MFIIFVTMATEQTDRQNFYKILQFQSKLSYSCKQKYVNMYIYTHSGKSTSY